MNSEKKVLVLSYVFSHGDAVTGLNVFSGWEKDNLYCATTTYNSDKDTFKSIYILGQSEISPVWPFSLFLKFPSSGVLTDQPNQSEGGYSGGVIKSILQKTSRYFFPYGFRKKASLSKEFCDWIENIKPDYIYTSVSDLAFAKLILLLMEKYPDIRFVVHLYDDWTSPSYKILYKGIFQKICEKKLSQIINKAYKCLAISDYMAKRYTLRYNKEFEWLPNPINNSDVVPIQQKNNNVVFMGKILMHNYEAILNMAKAITRVNKERNDNLRFDVYSTYNYFDHERVAKEYPCCHFHGWVDHAEVMNVLCTGKILYLPITSSKEVQKFTKYSMSTKIPEYMSSMTPILYSGPKDIAMTDLLESSNTAFVIGGSSVEEIKDAVVEILENENKVAELCNNARDFVAKYMTKDIVSKKLHQILN